MPVQKVGNLTLSFDTYFFIQFDTYSQNMHGQIGATVEEVESPSMTTQEAVQNMSYIQDGLEIMFHIMKFYAYQHS